MARTTAFTAVTGAVFLGNGEVEEKGIVAPEDGIKGELYDRLKAELEKRNVVIGEKPVYT